MRRAPIAKMQSSVEYETFMEPVVLEFPNKKCPFPYEPKHCFLLSLHIFSLA